MRRALVTFKRTDGTIQAEILAKADEFAELVDARNGEVLHREPFVLNGDEWIVHEVSVSEDMLLITCLAASSGERTQVARRTGSRNA